MIKIPDVQACPGFFAYIRRLSKLCLLRKCAHLCWNHAMGKRTSRLFLTPSSVPEGGKLCVTACEVSEANGTCGYAIIQPHRPRRGRTTAKRIIMSYTKLLYHIVFRPKDSAPAISEEHEESLYRYIWGFVKSRGCVLYRIGGMPDHVHMLVQIPPSLAVSDFMRDLKTSASKFMHDEKDKFPLFCGWGKSYCALTCSSSAKNGVMEYIKRQKEHHAKVGSREELLALLEQSGVEVDMRFFLKE